MMVARKDGCWLAFVALVIAIILYAFFVQSNKNEWCIYAINGGDCEYYEEDEYCYCIDTFKYKNITGNEMLDIFSLSEAQCGALNGSLVAPDKDNLSMWLAKHMFFMNAETAVIALRLMSSNWYWIKDGIQEEAIDIMWRQDVAHNPNHNVETVKKNVQDDIYIYYNYDHYVDENENYKWYGFGTQTEDYAPETYYICKYDIDPCYCSAVAEIYLHGLDDSHTFQSPQYPKNYCSDHNCKWLVSVSDGYAIQIDWLVFSVEDYMDYVYIHDGPTGKSPIIKECTGWKCGSQRSTRSQLLVHFSSDHVTTDLGFMARVTAVELDECYCSDLVSITLTNVGESFMVSSSNYPKSYCPNMNCKWLINAPKDLGIEFHWENFETETDEDFVSLHDGNQIDNYFIDKCSGKTCPSFRSSTSQVYVEFVSNNHNTSDAGFRFIAQVVKNYCTLDALFQGVIPKLGIVTSTKAPLNDANIGHGSVVTLVCPAHHKISNTVGQITDSTTCHSPLWSNHLGECIPVCHLEFSTHYKLDDIHFCRFGENLVTQLVTKGDEITVSRYDYVNGNRLIEKNNYTCVDVNTWNKQPPECHPMGILLSGGSMTMDAGYSMELYTPADKMQPSELLDMQLLRLHSFPSSVVLPGGDVLVIGSSVNSDSSAEENPVTKVVERINIPAMQVGYGPEISLTQGGSAAVLNGTVYVCGGAYYNAFEPSYLGPSYHKACELFQNGKWVPGIPMLVPRYKFGMVAIGQSLYAIGAKGGFVVNHCEKSAEKFSLREQSWQFIAPVTNCRYDYATAALEGFIYVCGVQKGDRYSSCEIYSPKHDKWHVMAAKMIVNNLTDLYYNLVAFDGSLFAFGRFFDGITVEIFDVESGWRKSAGKTDQIRSGSAAVMVQYDGNIPWKENQTKVINSKLDHVLNISALRQIEVLSEEGIPAIFLGIVDRGFDLESETCECETKTIELLKLEDSATLESPGYPDHYCNYQQCLWTISTVDSPETQLTVSLKWTAFSTENQMDMVHIYDEIGFLEVCGSHCANHKSRGNMLFVYFESDHVTIDIGFKAQVTAIDADPCYCSDTTEVILNSPDERFALESPNYPQPYCANHRCAWHISVAKDLLIKISWKTFHLGQGHSFNITQGQDGTLLSSCANNTCQDLQTSNNDELYLEFLSNGHISDAGNVFSALITAVLSYCMKLMPVVGSISYDRESRPDGNHPNGTVATLICPNRYKVSDSLRDTNSSITCVVPAWNQRLKTCAQVCKVDTSFISFNHTNICTYDDGIHTDFVPVGHELLVKEYNFVAQTSKPESEQVFKCYSSGWSPETPICHRLAILMHGEIDAHSDAIPAGKHLYLHYPEEGTTDVLEMTLDLSHDSYMTNKVDYPLFIASTLNESHVLVSGETTGSLLLDIAKGAITRTPAPVVPRRAAAAAQLAGHVYLCGGKSGYIHDTKLLSSCEVWRSNQWFLLEADLKTGREHLSMAATPDSLFVMGGIDSAYQILSSVEKYSLETASWEHVAPMPVAVHFASAVHYHGLIVLCGGSGDTSSYTQSSQCHTYHTTEDRWQEMASMNYKRQQFNMVVFAGRIYVLGGLVCEMPYPDIPVLTIEIYDDQNHQWIIQKELPSIIQKAISPSAIVAVNWQVPVL